MGSSAFKCTCCEPREDQFSFQASTKNSNIREHLAVVNIITVSTTSRQASAYVSLGFTKAATATTESSVKYAFAIATKPIFVIQATIGA